MPSLKIDIVARSLIDKMKSIRNDSLSRKNASNALTHIEKDKGKLSNILRKIADEYAIEVLGSKKYAPWLYVYTVIAEDFKEGWIPDNYYRELVVPKVQGAYGKLSFLKTLNNKLFNSPISPDIAYFINGKWFSGDHTALNRSDLKPLLFATSNQVVFKSNQSYQGRGVFLINETSFNVDTIESYGDGIIQQYIDQHSFFNEFTSDSVGNIRITTVIDLNNEPSLRSCYLRLGRKNDLHVKSENHIRIPIYLNSGELYDKGYLANWQTIEKHPDTNVHFAKKQVPAFDTCIQHVLALHKRIPMVQSIGWDLAVNDDEEPIIMEWNGFGNDIKFSEATQGPCFKDLDW